LDSDQPPLAQSEESPTDPEAELARVQSAIGTLVSLMNHLHDERIVAVGKKFFELLGGGTAAIKEARPPWPLEWQADWIDGQLEAIETNLAKLAAELPDELRQKVGTELVNDHLEEIKARTAELLDTIREGNMKILERDLPEGMKYRAHRPLAASEDDDDESSSVVDQGSVRTWVISLHGGQLVMMLLFSGTLAFVLALGGFLAWAANSYGVLTVGLTVASIALFGFDAWSLWVWLGSRSRPPTERPSQA
jgi:hypothetical protein